jgi:hypothetical protein
MERIVGSPANGQPRGLNLGAPAEFSPRHPVASLFRRFAVEVLVVGPRLEAGMVDNTAPMIRRRIEWIPLVRPL